MSSERVFLIAPVEAILIAEPTVESRPISDADIPDVAQLVVDAATGSPGLELTLDESRAKLDDLLSGSNGEPRRDAWLGVWEGYGTPVSAIMCTNWRGMPYIAQILTQPSSRGRGYASSLVRQATAIIEADGGTHVGLALEPGSPATDLFRELGFKEMFTPAGL